MIKIDVSKDGVIKIKNEKKKKIKIWTIEFTYYVTLPKEEINKKNTFIRKKKKKKINGPILLGQKNVFEQKIGIPCNSLQEIIVYYEENGEYLKTSLKIN